MSDESTIKRLSAGLDRLEALARAATELPKITPRFPAKRPLWEPERWVPARDDVRTVNGAADPIHEAGGTRSRSVAEFIAYRDPADALKWVETIRKVIDIEIAELAACDEKYGDGCSREDIRAGRCTKHGRLDSSAIIAALASIYSDEATEGLPPRAIRDRSTGGAQGGRNTMSDTDDDIGPATPMSDEHIDEHLRERYAAMREVRGHA